MASRFATIIIERKLLAGNEAAAPTNIKKETTYGLVFTSR